MSCVKVLKFLMGIQFAVVFTLSIIFSFKYTQYDFENNKIISEIFINEKIKDISFEDLLSYQNHSNRSVLTLKIISYIIFADTGIILITIIIFCIIAKIKKEDMFMKWYTYAVAFIIIFALVTVAQIITNIVVLVYTIKIRLYLDLDGHDALTEGFYELLNCTYDNYFYSLIVNGSFSFLLILLIIQACLENK